MAGDPHCVRFSKRTYVMRASRAGVRVHDRVCIQALCDTKMEVVTLAYVEC